MASASQSFPSRPYSNALHGKPPDRSAAPGGGGSGGFGATSSRETARLERERERGQQMQGPQQTMSGITDEQREEISEAFSLFDLDKDQRIDYHEFKVALKALGFDLPKSEILSLLTAHGIPPLPPAQAQPHSSRASAPQEPTPPGRLQLTLPAFQTIASNLVAHRDPREEILRAFQLFDTDDKGMISLEDLRRVARELGEGLEEEELVAMIEEFDLEGKGGVGKDEFIAICMG